MRVWVCGRSVVFRDTESVKVGVWFRFIIFEGGVFFVRGIVFLYLVRNFFE